MQQLDPRPEFDSRYSEPSASATPWAQTARALEQAELYWLSTVRADGRPHVTPLIGVVADGAPHFCTGLEEQKARNLQGRTDVALTTGANAWAAGLDVVVEGSAVRVTDEATLRSLAAAYLEKYGEAWRFGVGDGGFDTDGHFAAVFRIEPAKVLAFAKQPHGQTRYRLG
jgi:nitroimidazol reductase NimA-like FMN-containing flavoprotein (pyridoxamine 5'-phosphate oxidase superfamily)